MEEWKQIIDYPNYSVNNFGNVRNNKTGRILKPQSHNSGKYLGVDLGRGNRKTIHSLVGKTFLEKPDENVEIDHIDLNGCNNHLENLRWVTRSQNQQHKNKNKNCLSKFKGVTFDKQKNKWKCHLRVNGKNKHIGHFNTEEECALAYNNYIKEQNMSFCIPNNLK